MNAPTASVPSLKSIIAREGRAFGTMCFEFFVPGLPAIIAPTGAQFALFDMEHTGASFETIKMLCAGCRGVGVTPIVRIPTTRTDYISRALDVGAQGIMVPMVETREQAELIVASTYYPPRGRRGAGFSLAHDDYRPGAPADKMAAVGERVMILPQIETRTGLENVEEIAAVDGVDIVWMGHFDLTNFMGIPGQFDHPDYLAALDRIIAAARAAGKPAGFLAADMAWARRYWEIGFRVLAYGLDHLMFQQALRQGIDGMRELR